MGQFGGVGTSISRLPFAAGADRLLLVRTFDDVRIHRLTAGELTFLTRLRTRERFGAAVESAIDADPAFDPGASLKNFVTLRAIVDFYL